MITTTISYILYIILSVSLTIWVGKVLFTNGRIFILDAFKGNTEMTDAVNSLLLAGFYLINIGIVSLYLRYGTQPETAVEAIEYISTKIGVVLLVLGGMHYFNMINIAKMRKKSFFKPQPVEAEPTSSRPNKTIVATG